MTTCSLLEEWLRERPRTRAIICDLDDTLCTCFDVPLAHGCRFLAALDRSVEVHYVTARPEASRAGTEKFLADHRLPGWRNVHYCPSWQSARQHKHEVIARLARMYAVLVSIGDHDDEADASAAVGVPFVRVADDNHEQAWHQVALLVATGPLASPA
jgi:hypothetical protein